MLLAGSSPTSTTASPGTRSCSRARRATSAATLSRSAAAIALPSMTVALTRAPSEYVRQDIERDHVADENDDQDQDHRRDVDAAEAGQRVADRPQRWLGDAVEEIGDLRDHRVARIH